MKPLYRPENLCYNHNIQGDVFSFLYPRSNVRGEEVDEP